MRWAPRPGAPRREGWGPPALTALPWQVMLQLEKKLFDYFNQEVFRDDNGTAVSSGIRRVAGPPAAALGWRWPPAPPNAPAFPGPWFPVPSQPVGRLPNPHPPLTSPLGPSWGGVLPPAGLRPPASLPVPASVALSTGVLPGERQRARGFGCRTPGSGPAHRGLGCLWKTTMRICGGISVAVNARVCVCVCAEGSIDMCERTPAVQTTRRAPSLQRDSLGRPAPAAPFTSCASVGPAFDAFIRRLCCIST